MKTLPLYEEIAQARRLAEEANAATLALRHLASVSQSLSILQSTSQTKTGWSAPLPGEDLIRELSEAWPALAGLRQSDPSSLSTFSAQLAGREAQLGLAKQVLEAIAGELAVRNNTLARLQAEQQVRLADPIWADEVDRLGEIGIDRDRAARELAPLNQRLAMVEPAMTVLRSFLTAIRNEVEKGTEREDVSAVHAWRTATIAQRLLDALESLVAHVRLEIPFPDPLDIDPSPIAERRLHYWREVGRVSSELTALLKVLRSEGGKLRSDATRLNSEYEALTKQILDQMG